MIFLMRSSLTRQKSLTTSIARKFQKLLEADDADYSESVKCVLKKAGELSANLEFQREFVYDNDKSLSSFKRQTLIAETQTDLASIVDLAGIYCEPDKRFGEFFDGVYELNYTKLNVTNIELLRED